MLKKSLKAIITGVFVVSMFSTTIICSAAETKTASVTTTAAATTTTSTTTTKSHHSKQSLASDVHSTTTGVTTTPTSGATTTTGEYTTGTSRAETTTAKETTSVETTTTTEVTTTTTEATTTTTALLTSTDAQGNDLILYKDISYADKLLAMQDVVDSYLYNTSFKPDESLVLAKKYIKAVAVLNDISSDDILYLYKYANNIVDLQKKQLKSNEAFYTNLEKTIAKVDYTNYTSLETYCRNLITTAFKNEAISSKETLTLLDSIHDRVMSCLTEEDLELAKYYNYKFVSSQTVLAQWGAYNPDIKGWIYIDGVSVDSPLVQTPFADNEYYLQHAWDGSVSSRGTIELDYRSSLTSDNPNETDNALIYGHNLSDGTMFSNLIYYKDRSYWEEHQLIEITTDGEQRLYKIYAVCSVYGLDDGTQFKYWDDKYVNMDEETFNEHVALTRQTMLYDTDSFPKFGEDILTLQTCDGSNNWRLVLFAKRVK